MQGDVLTRLEAVRRGATFADAASLALAREPLFEDLDDICWLSRSFGGVRAALTGRVGWRCARRHPRETLARASIRLAYDDDRPAALAWAKAALHAKSARPSDVAESLAHLVEVAA
jgi:hypothetical protein